MASVDTDTDSGSFSEVGTIGALIFYSQCGTARGYFVGFFMLFSVCELGDFATPLAFSTFMCVCARVVCVAMSSHVVWTPVSPLSILVEYNMWVSGASPAVVDQGGREKKVNT